MERVRYVHFDRIFITATLIFGRKRYPGSAGAQARNYPRSGYSRVPNCGRDMLIRHPILISLGKLSSDPTKIKIDATFFVSKMLFPTKSIKNCSFHLSQFLKSLHLYAN